MLVEQSFFSLPQILLGTGYQSQSYESGIVTAFTLSFLQVMNGLNYDNPISCFQAEKLYRKDGLFKSGGNTRYLRADLYADIGRLMVANRNLSQYGWKHNIWMECKFFRDQTGDGTKSSSNKTSATGSIMADLLRLSLLVPEEKEITSNGRYLLHVYDDKPEQYLTYRNRPWCKSLVKEGVNVLSFSNLDQQPKAVLKLIGSLPGLDVKLTVTNFHSGPIYVAHRPVYWCWLTRIDKVQASLNDSTVIIDFDRKIDKPGVLKEIAGFVGENIAIQPASPDSMSLRQGEQDNSADEEDTSASL